MLAAAAFLQVASETAGFGSTVCILLMIGGRCIMPLRVRKHNSNAIVVATTGWFSKLQ